MGRNQRRNNGQFTKEPEETTKPEVEPVDEEERDVEIDDEPEDEPDDEPAEAAPSDPEAAKQWSRKQAKKQKRLQELRLEDEKRVQERIDAAEAARREAEAQAAYARGVLEQQARQQQGHQEDPLEAEVKRAQRRRMELERVFQALSPEEQQTKRAEMEEEFLLEARKEQEAIAEIVNRRNGGGRQVDPMAGVRQHLVQKHAADIMSSPRNVQEYGILAHEALVRQGYPAWNEETIALAAQRTREAFPNLFPQSTQRRAAPQPRSTMMSVRSSGGAPPTNGGERRTVKMNAQLRGLARAQYPNDTPEVAYKKWAKDHDEWRRKHPEDEHVKSGG